MILTDVQQVAQTAILAQSLGALESKTVLDAAVPFTNEQKTDFVRIAERHEKNISEYIRWLIDKQRKEDEKNENI